MKIILILIRFYQLFISSAIGSNCRFHPSCSEYLKQALLSSGLFRGLGAGMRRIFKCHPFSEGGYDPVAVHNKGKSK